MNLIESHMNGVVSGGLNGGVIELLEFIAKNPGMRAKDI